MGRIYYDQPFATTSLDAHGEKRDRAFLQELMELFGGRAPLRDNHDVTAPPLGYMVNPRVVEDPERPGEYQLLVDIHTELEELPPDYTGFSFSMLKGIRSNLPDPEVAFFLPWPLYNDHQLLDDLLAQEHPVAVGKWLKKGLVTPEIALVATIVTFLLRPVWDQIYRETVYPKLHAQWAQLRKLWDQGISTDHRQNCSYPDGTPVKVDFIPERGLEKICLGEAALDEGMMLANRTVLDLTLEKGKRVRTLRLVYSSRGAAYRICDVEFEDGEAIYFTET